MKKIITIFICLALSSLQISAQKRTRITPEQQRLADYTSYADSITGRFATDMQSGRTDSTAIDDTPADATGLSPYLFRLTVPTVYYSSSISHRFDLADADAGPSKTSTTPGMDYRDRMNDAVDDALTYRYLNQPASFRYYDSKFQNEQLVGEATITEAKPEDLKDVLTKKEKDVKVADIVGPLDIGLKIDRPNFWTTKGTFGLQFSQNYFSEKWYKGGNNNLNMLSTLLLEANYNDQTNIQWDNKFEAKLGFITTTSDTVHRFLTNNDKLYLFTKLGVRAWEQFFYTIKGEAQSQSMPGYRSNDTTAYSRFLAPLDVFVSVGIDFKPKLKNGNSLSLELLPLSYKLRYIHGGDETIIKAYSMRDKLRCQSDFGSKLEFNSTINIAKNFRWRGRLYYYTTYKYVEAEWENTLTFNFNKYITTEVNALWRFDDNRDMKFWDDSLGFFQFKEFFTLGLTYTF